ncbi:hypothetical protein ThrDRAFT_01923 [Frankia casuarinae]|uniref:hypothetical protein n=1 Tax=Frankia TaxID=1854 RepID=UPI0003CFB3D6|nr:MULTISPECIES: hypothetical protein [Frankia]ETA01803.1 hypothetical protein CcI6DRAFT_02814 [Frankia sp. CcI6]KDA41291.1 hypothetical protein BMG523Draft_03879 [Frankia sp. BMG5.23]KEZ35235.1 hypothetical protein CEDDRAFT_03410 [Frankia sp. CeD]KFB04062.1 hypothetical protein ALLO2DRAFT_03116 [Frankia sp. Allo2]EYT92474.1 hypothetical protein ThrDRAFT_01923 [Frankia casuarinae]
MVQRPKHRDKRGNTSGGSSTGRSGTKRGGTKNTADPDDMVNQGPLTCPTCGGSGRAGRPTAELDADGMFDGQGKDKCTSCDGTGKQKR